MNFRDGTEIGPIRQALVEIVMNGLFKFRRSLVWVHSARFRNHLETQFDQIRNVFNSCNSKDIFIHRQKFTKAVRRVTSRNDFGLYGQADEVRSKESPSAFNLRLIF